MEDTTKILIGVGAAGLVLFALHLRNANAAAANSNGALQSSGYASGVSYASPYSAGSYSLSSPSNISTVAPAAVAAPIDFTALISALGKQQDNANTQLQINNNQSALNTVSGIFNNLVNQSINTNVGRESGSGTINESLNAATPNGNITISGMVTQTNAPVYHAPPIPLPAPIVPVPPPVPVAPVQQSGGK